MVASSRAQLIGAHLERGRLGRLERVLGPLLDTRGRGAGAHVRSLAFASMRRTALGRRILLGAGLAAGSIAVLVAIAGVATYLIVF